MPTFDVTIEKLVVGALGIGQVEGKRVLVPLVAPGERVRVAPLEDHRKYFKARLIEILEPHPSRRPPPCPHFGLCGGCDLQFLPHAEQLAAKRELVLDAFRRIGSLDLGETLPDPAAVCAEFGYRNRIRLSYEAGGRVGLVRRGSNRVVPIERCLLMPEAWNQHALPWLRTLPTADKAAFRLDPKDRMIAAITGHPGLRDRLFKRMQALAKGEAPFPGALGVLFNAKPIKGSAVFEVDFAGARFQVDAASFFQVNYTGAEKLVDAVRRAFGEERGGVFVDLYAGVGMFAILLADRFERSIGVEIARSAVRDFARNLEMNAVTNVDLLEGSVETVLPDLAARLASAGPVTVLVDPPRTGLEENVLPFLATVAPRRIVYVSCDPATLARDTARLRESGYSLASIEIIDLFPQTAHVECVVALQKNSD